LKKAILADRLDSYRGTSRVAIALSDILDAPVYTYSKSVDPEVEKRISEIHKGPGLPRFMSSTFDQMKYWPSLDIDADLVVSVGPYSKSYEPTGGQRHLSYFQCPQEYLTSNSQYPLKYLASKFVNRVVREWELKSIEGADELIANSEFTQELARKYWDEEVDVIHPPVDVDKYKFEGYGDFFLYISKGEDLTNFISPFPPPNNPEAELKIIGNMEKNSRKLAERKDTVEALGWVSEERKINLLARCRAGATMVENEHFGIIPIEFMASGKPVIALKSGGFRYTIEEGVTGVFIENNRVESVEKALKKFRNVEWNKDEIMNYSRRFSKEKFEEEIKSIVNL